MLSQRVRDILCFLKEQKITFFCLGIAAALNWNLFALWNMTLVCDEGDHLLKIQAFRSGEFGTVPYLAMFPVYHGLMGGLLQGMNAKTLAQVRLVTFLGSLGTIGAFYLLAERLWPSEKLLRTAQFIFIPIVFPFLPLIYTDIWALGFAILTVERSLAGRPAASAAAAFIAAMLRTPNIVWGLLAWLLLYFAQDNAMQLNKEGLVNWLKRTWQFVLLFISFFVFVILNHGAAIGDKLNQPITLNFSTIWFFLFLFFFTFIPTCLAQARQFFRPSTPRLGVFTIAAFIGVLYFYTYAIHHPYNQPGLWLYLRNRLLYWTTRYEFVKCIALVPVLIAAFALAFASLAKPQLRWVTPIALASIIFTPIIEQRYYLEAFAFFQAFRRSQSDRFEVANLFFYILISLWLVHGIAMHQFFL